MFSLIVCRFWFVIRQLFDKTVNNRLCLSFLCHHIICIVQCKSSKKVLNEKTIYKELTKDEKHKSNGHLPSNILRYLSADSIRVRVVSQQMHKLRRSCFYCDIITGQDTCFLEEIAGVVPVHRHGS